MKKHLLKSLLAVALLLVCGNVWGETVTYTMTPDKNTTGNNSTSYVTTAFTFTYSDISWSFNQWNPSTLQIKTNQGTNTNEFYFWNTSAFPGRITQVVITFSALTVSDASKLCFVGGTSAISSLSGGTAGTWDSTAKTLTWTPSGESNYTYFAFYQNGKAASGTNNLAESNAIVVTYETAGPSIPKLAMSDITCTSHSTESLTFEWSAVENAAGYEVTFGNEDPITISGTSYTANNLNSNTEYTISVKAVGNGTDYLTSDAKTLKQSTDKKQFTITWSANSNTTTTTIAEGDALVLPTEVPAAVGDNVFIGWSQSQTVATDGTGITYAKNGDAVTGSVTYYAVYADASDGGIVWQKTEADKVTEGVYAIITTDGHAFNGTISDQGHGLVTSTVFSFTNSIATSAPEGTCEITMIPSESGYAMYNANNGYLYAKAASSGKLAWHNTENSYWSYASSNWKYNSNDAFLRNYSNNSIRTYGQNNGEVIQFAKKVSNYTGYTTTPVAATKYSITLNQPEVGGKIAANKTEAAAGKIVTLTATPAAHYSFANWTVMCGETPVTVTDNQFTMPAGNVTVSATFNEDAKYDITAQAATGGTYTVQKDDEAVVTVSSENVVFQAYENDVFVLTPTANEGYKVGSTPFTLTVGEGLSKPTLNTVEGNQKKFTVGTCAVTISASFSKLYTITPNVTEGGSIEINFNGKDETLQASRNTSITVTATPDAGFELGSLYYITDAEVGEGDEPQQVPVTSGTAFQMPGFNITLYAIFTAKARYGITATATGNGTVSVDPTEAYEGQTVTITSTPDTHWSLSALSVTNGENEIEVTDNTFEMPAGTVSVSATFTEFAKYQVVFYSLDEKLSDEMIYDGDEVAAPSITEMPEGYSFMGWTTAPIEGVSATAPAVLYATVPVASENVTYYAVFAEETTGSQETVTETETSWSWSSIESYCGCTYGMKSASEYIGNKSAWTIDFSKASNASIKLQVECFSNPKADVMGVYLVNSSGEKVGEEQTFNTTHFGSESSKKGWDQELTFTPSAGVTGYKVYLKTKNSNGAVVTGVKYTVTYLPSVKSNFRTSMSINVRITSAGWATAYLPYDAEIPSGVEAYYVTVDESGALAKTQITSCVPEGTGVLLKGNAGDYTFSKVALDNYEEDVYADNMLKGTCDEGGKNFDERGFTYYILGNGSQGVGFYWDYANYDELEGLGAHCAQYKAVLAVPDKSGSNAVRGFGLNGTTMVEQLLQENNDATIYDLQGRKVDNASKGLYIVGGKKVFVK